MALRSQIETLNQQNTTLSSQMENISPTLQLLGEKLTTPNAPTFEINQTQPNFRVTPMMENDLNYFWNTNNSETRSWKTKKLDLPMFDGNNPYGWIMNVEHFF